MALSDGHGEDTHRSAVGWGAGGPTEDTQRAPRVGVPLASRRLAGPPADLKRVCMASGWDTSGGRSHFSCLASRRDDEWNSPTMDGERRLEHGGVATDGVGEAAWAAGGQGGSV